MKTNSDTGLGAALVTLYHRMSPARRRQGALTVVLMLLASVAELMAIGTVVPFLSLLANPEKVMGYAPLTDLLGSAMPQTRRGLLIAVTGLFVASAIFAGIIRLALTWVSQAFVFKLGHDFGVEIHRRMLYQPYTYHVKHNASEPLAALEQVQQLVFNVLLPLMLGVTAAMMSIFIIAMLTLIDPVSALAASGAFALVYVLVSVATRGRLHRNSAVINAAYAQRVQAVQEGLGGIRDVILDQSQPVYLAQFSQIDARFRTAQAMNQFVGAAPRFLIETAGLVLMALVALLVSARQGGLTEALPIIGALALGAQRLLPLLQQVYLAWAQARGSGHLVNDVVRLLSLEPEHGEGALTTVSFRDEIRLRGVGFTYLERRGAVLDGIDLVIRHGSRVAFVGRTGSGKSTLIDILMGLLPTTAGTMSVDGVVIEGDLRRGWQRLVAHVPQAIFLSDTSITRNIAFGEPIDAIDHDRVVAAARQAQLHDFVAELPDGYDTRVGERGVQLSGGQRQRLGIARALYKRPQVLILDEATSALDDQTEAKVMEAISRLDRSLTVIMIAHRLSTIANCDDVIRLDGGKIIDSGDPKAISAALKSQIQA